MSGLDYGVVSTAPTPPPMPGQIITHFPANPKIPDYSNTNSAQAGQMIEKRRVSIVNTTGSTLNGKHSLSSNINIITSPDKHILPGVYK